MRLRVNTAFEVAVAAGLETGYTDKHPAYALVRGPSNTGLTTEYFPEIAAVDNTVDAVIAYDQLHVNAWLEWIDGMVPANSQGSLKKIPSLFGGNYQCLSVAQKTVEYNNDSSLSAGILKALDFVDRSMSQVVSKLKSKGYLQDTLIVVASKHGQAPIHPTLWNEVNPDTLMNATGVPTAWVTVSRDSPLWFPSPTNPGKERRHRLDFPAQLVRHSKGRRQSVWKEGSTENPRAYLRIPAHRARLRRSRH